MAGGSGKILQKSSQRLGYLYIDTGAMYRAITYLAIKNIPEDEQAITDLTENQNPSQFQEW
jgi:cytidylate kinase